ncbi:MAG TPA: hypothetical protein VFG36_00130 [Methanoregula sp.]|nr:hypothetical protein [Methanoregula sp.]
MFFPIAMLIGVICIIQPVLAEEGIVSISYRGAGGYTIGDVITFDGRNTAGNTTLLKITGPGLPETGVPVYNLDGNPGSGNTIPVNADGTWKFVWYSANIAGIEKMITARYTIIAADSGNPAKTASTSILMKKPEFYINPIREANPGQYVELSGNAEQGVTYVKIDITDSENRVLHTYISPVSGSGSFNYGFRVDFGPGQYTVTVSNPSLENALTRVFTVTSPGTPVPSPTTTGVTQVPAETVPPVTVSTAYQTVVPSTSQSPRVPLSVFTPFAGIVICGLIIIRMSTVNRK